ncbi:DUF6377 domain-containing protein [Nonlabens sp.]|uniref:DUF6377 domain-containing protein n=1 Tax=Nonlabens sp. TaxID=1888209 RepID=UPI003F699146
MRILFIVFKCNFFKYSILFLVLLVSAFSYSRDKLDSLIVTLEYKMDMRHSFDTQKEDRINFLENESSQTLDLEKKYLINRKIIGEYKFYSFDKALEYIERNILIAEKLENDLYINESKLILSLLLVESGRYKESVDALNEIKRNSLPKSLINDYYLAFEEGYSGLSYNTTVKRSKEFYNQLYKKYQDSLYSRLDPNSEVSLRLKEKELRDNRMLDQALLINSRRLKNVDAGSRAFSLISFERSLLFQLKMDFVKQKEYLILSAISDIEASVKDNASTSTLAKILFEEGDIDRAHRYINFSFDDAIFYNSQLRFVNIANSLPIITKAYEERRAGQKDKLEILLGFISFLAIFLVIAIFLIFKQIKKVSQARNKLAAANNKLSEFNIQLNNSNKDLKLIYKKLSDSDKIKEHYIGTFLNLYSEYITKLDVYRKLVSKYVNSNQMNSLLELSKSKRFIDDELEIFNKNFDRSFLHIYPDFVKSVNLLLKAEYQIELSDPSKLNTELRIIALIKLGITSSSRISKILRYSVNTIYNYRAGIRNTAIDKLTFEDMIKNIQ